jgi:hypothetical protein
MTLCAKGCYAGCHLCLELRSFIVTRTAYILSVVFIYCYAECRHAECHGAISSSSTNDCFPYKLALRYKH